MLNFRKYDIKFNNTLIYSGGNTDLCSFLRHDFTYQKVITIDDEGNKCNDDGFYIERNCDGSYTLYIHISDVPSLVKKDSLIDLYAYKELKIEKNSARRSSPTIRTFAGYGSPTRSAFFQFSIFNFQFRIKPTARSAFRSSLPALRAELRRP